MKIFGNISFKIWISFSSIIIITMALVTYYFYQKQTESIAKYRGKELQELSRTIALGVELSLDANDYQKLNKSIDYFKINKNDIDFLVLLQHDSLTKSPLVFAQVHDNKLWNYLKMDTAKFLIKEASFSTLVMNGKVLIGLSKDKISSEVKKTLLPVYLILLMMLLITVVLFYMVAKQISAPIKLAITNAKMLENNNFEGFNLVTKPLDDEFTSLLNALVSLKNSLLTQKTENHYLLNNLENKVEERTLNLQKTLSLLNEAQEIALLGYYSYNQNKNELILSENLYAIIGISEHSIQNLEGLKAIINPDYQSDLEMWFSQQPIDSFYLEVKTVLKDPATANEKWIALNGKCAKDKETGKCFLTGTVQDITKQKNAESELRKLSQAVKNSYNSIIITDLNENILWVNDSVLKLTGYSREEIIGNTPRMFQFEQTDVQTKKLIRENLLAFKAFKTEILNIGKNGRKYWLDLYIQPILDEKGRPEGYMAIEIDITTRKEKEKLIQQYITEIENKQKEISSINANLELKVAEKTKDLELSLIQLQQSQDEIIKKEKLATLGLLIAGIAHEVNTPLGAIKASADNLEFLFTMEFLGVLNQIALQDAKQAFSLFLELKEKPVLSTMEQRSNAKKMQQDIENAHPELSNTLTLSKELAYCGFYQYNDSLKLLIEQANHQDLFKMLKLLLNIHRSLKTINEGAVKSSKIIKALNVYSHGSSQAVFTNFNLKDNVDNIITLLWNKIKYHATVKNNIPDNTLLFGLEDELSQVWTNIINNALQAAGNKCNIEINYRQVDNYHYIAISNDGPAIAPDIIDKIFDEFFTTKKRGEGTGLGLNIVKNIVEKHQGQIACSSNESITTFTIKIPVESL